MISESEQRDQIKLSHSLLSTYLALSEGDGRQFLGEPHLFSELVEIGGGIRPDWEDEDEGRGRRGVLEHQRQVGRLWGEQGRTSRELVENLYRTCTELVQNLYRTCTELVENLWRTFRELVEEKLWRTSRELVPQWRTCRREQVDNLWRTCRELLENLQRAGWLSGDEIFWVASMCTWMCKIVDGKK